MKKSPPKSKLNLFWLRIRIWVIAALTFAAGFTTAYLVFGNSKYLDHKPMELTEKIDSSILRYIRASAYNPANYQPITTIIVDTIYFSDNVTILRGSDRGVLKSYIDSVLGSPNPNPLCAYLALHRCWLKNKIGQPDIFNYWVQVNQDGDILSFEEDQKKLIYLPNMLGNEKPID